MTADYHNQPARRTTRRNVVPVHGAAPADITGPLPNTRSAMSRAHHIACRIAATTLLLVIPGLAAQGVAQTPSENQAQRAGPSLEAAIAAFAKARQWIDEFQTPALDDPASSHALAESPADVPGVCIVLWRQGRPIGLGQDARGDALMLRRAAGKALNETLANPALQRLTTEAIKSDPQAAGVDSLRAQLGRSMVLELEIAGPLTPLIGKSLGQLARHLEPGLDGVAVRRGDDLHLHFPSAMRLNNSAGDGRRVLLNLMLSAGFAAHEIDDALTRNQVSLYRFRTTHLAQTAPDGTPALMFRGQRLVKESEVTQAGIVSFANRLATHLLGSMWPEAPDAVSANGLPLPASEQRPPLGIRGAYRTSADLFEPMFAPPLDQAMAALALGRHAACDAVGKAEAEASGKGAHRLLRDLAIVTTAEVDPSEDLAACAMVLYAIGAINDSLGDPDIVALHKRCVDRLAAAVGEAGIEHRQAGGNAAESPERLAMIAGALARELNRDAQSPPPWSDRTVRLALDQAWRSCPPRLQVGLLPWIAWGEFDLADAISRPPGHIAELRAMLAALEDSRIGSAHRPGEPDLHGGLVLEADERGGPVAATSQTARPAAWMADVMNNELFIEPDQRAAAIGRHLRTMRFLMQLAVRDEQLGRLAQPDQALGGIRAAPWDADQPVPAQALALITAVHTLETLRSHSP